MPSVENSKKMPIFWGIVIIIVGIVGIVLWLFQGKTGGFWVFIKWFLVAIIVLGVLGLIVYAIFWLFSKQPSDAIFLNVQRYIKACNMNKPTFPQFLYFKGSGEWEFKKIGKIIGVCQSKILKTNTEKPLKDKEGIVIKDKTLMGYDKTNKPIYKEVIRYEQEELTEDVIAFKRGGFLAPVELVRVLKHERTSLNSDKVFLNAMAFTPELYGFYYLPNRFRNKELIDRVVGDEIHRATIQHILKEEQNIVDDAIAISPRHQKEMEKTKFQVISSGTPIETKG